MTGLHWSWIVFALTVPALLGGAVAYPIWRTGQPVFGNIAGSAVIFAAAVGLIMREHVELDRVVQDCLDHAVTCWPEPSAFTRFAIYAFIGLLQVIVLFSVSVRVETVANLWEQEQFLIERRKPKLRRGLRVAIFTFDAEAAGNGAKNVGQLAHLNSVGSRRPR